ncbi:MAG: hypothetical protein IKF83_00755 [Clostridia bacterium]|nr:hypothetical protein [Clostridia bacterium]
MKKIKVNKRDMLALIILAFAVGISIAYVFNKSLQEYKFANQMENLYAKNENPVFTLDKIVMYSSANAIDNSEGQTMQDLNVCQFTDIAVFIDNMVDIPSLIKESDAMNVSTVTTDDEASRKIKEHTIKELYIDNIKINSASSKGTKTLQYKNPSGFGKFTINNAEQTDRINFDVISTNVDNEERDYTNPTFYADCSNPITLNYMNKNLVTNYAVSTQDTQIKFDGSILQSVGTPLDDLICNVGFDIHMKNNLNQNFACSVSLDIPIKNENKNIYNGYMYGMQDNLQSKYKFFKN